MAAAIAAMVSMNPSTAQAEDHRFKNFGDFEQWIVRYIQESPIIGGQRKTIYAIGKTDTIRNNTPYVNPIQDNVWSVSNAYAKVVGIEKASGTVTPEKRGDGWCCRLEVRTEEVKVLGIINLTVMVTGTIFTGRTLEPVSNASRPYEKNARLVFLPSAFLYDCLNVVFLPETVFHKKVTSSCNFGESPEN